MQVFNQVLVLFLLILIGYGGRKTQAIEDTAVGHFSRFILHISLPALILASLQRPFSQELLQEALITLALSFALYGLYFLVAVLYPLAIPLFPQERGVHRYALIFSNVGFMGFPVVEALLGQGALFHLAIFNIPFNVLAFSIGAWLIAREGKRQVVLSWKTFVNPSVVATLLGFLLFVGSVKLPESLYRTIKMTGDITSPLSMIVIGAILARMDVRKIVGRWQYYVTVLVRLLGLPALVGALLYAVGLRGLLWVLPTIITAMPVAANTSILADVYGADAECASSLVFLSTLFCVATIPLVVLFGLGL
ncbi:MAG: AEC family transporter [Treponemataceae bacterium]|nr:AEC family transporter [Treponemataceae bacterium]HOJ99184.1 AEC family transporter [Termitinemataceae bacterium]HOM23179.1 AEC family transporter [Termitinemataceae bacterium]HPQ00365.1 AEC family transporter [Termitinemataceae bacterium]